jgi:putative ABC transport system ATP-binding protein
MGERLVKVSDARPLARRRGAAAILFPEGGMLGPVAAILRARDVAKSYDGRTDVLRDVDLDVDPEEAVLIAGPNGSGKSTLLAILGGLDVPTRGSVVLADREISRLREAELAKVRLHDVGFVFQAHNLIDDLTVAENIALPLRLARKPADARVEELLGAFGLARFATRRPREISMGESQRIAVARALANGPRVLLADEPTAALDRAGTAAVLAAFERARTSFRAALVIASHDAHPPPMDGTRYRLEGGTLARAP